MTPYHFSYVYILQSLRFPKELYIGFTRNLRRRYGEHNEGASPSTRRYAPWRLVYYEAFSEVQSAKERESQLKGNGNAMRELKKRTGLEVKSGKGFTLVEAMVAITIVTIAIAGPMYAANRAIVAAQTANNQFVAAHLAQEGIEYIRSMRDDAYLYQYGQGNPSASIDAWNDFSTNNPSNFSIWQCKKPNSTTNACTLDPFQPMGTGNGESLNPCHIPPLGNDCAPLYLTLSNIYTQDSSFPNVQTPFTRTVQVDDSSLGITNEVSVVSTVSWNFHDTPYSVSVTDHLTAWQ